MILSSILKRIVCAVNYRNVTFLCIDKVAAIKALRSINLKIALCPKNHTMIFKNLMKQSRYVCAKLLEVFGRCPAVVVFFR